MNRKLNAEIAVEIMGWKLIPAYKPESPWESSDREADWIEAKTEEFGEPWAYIGVNGSVTRVDADGDEFIFNPARSLDACSIAEAKMEELGLLHSYGYALRMALRSIIAKKRKEKGGQYPTHFNVSLGEIATAPIDVRCKAMLETVEGTKEEVK